MRSCGRRIALASGGGLTILVATAALAWACLPNANIVLSTNAGAPRSQVTVTGTDFTDKPVQIHWASATGPVLGTVTPTGGRFKVQVTVPEAAPDVYFVYAVGSAATRQRPFEVTEPAGAAPGPAPSDPSPTPEAQRPSEPPSAPSPSASPDPTESAGKAPATESGSAPAGPSTAPGPNAGTAPGSNPSTAPPRSGRTAPAQSPRRTAPAQSPRRTTRGPGSADAAPRRQRTTQAGGDAPGTVRREGRIDGPGRRPAAQAPAPAPSNRAPAQVVRTRSGQKVLAASLPARGPSAPEGKGARDNAQPFRASAPAGSERIPSLTSEAGSTALDDGTDLRLGIGVALLALGVLIPLAGFMVADVRRRRVRVRSDADR